MVGKCDYCGAEGDCWQDFGVTLCTDYPTCMRRKAQRVADNKDFAAMLEAMAANYELEQETKQ
jgi:hypothetical protein